jgi:Trk-type K+ transport system membrane component
VSRRKQRALRKSSDPVAPAARLPDQQRLPDPRPGDERLPAIDDGGGEYDPGPAIVQWMLGGYLVLAALGIVVFRGSGASGAMTAGSEMSGDRAVFEAVNAITLTGFRQDVGVGQFDAGSNVGPVMLLLLTLGGSFFSMVAGGMAVVRILRLPYSDARVMLAGGLAIFTATLAGSAVVAGGTHGWLASLTQAAGAFGNSGVHAGRLWPVASWQAHLGYLPLAFLGGMGLPVLMELYDRATSRASALSAHARVVLALSAGLYLGGFALLLAVREEFWRDLYAGLSGGGSTGNLGADLRRDIASSSAQSVNARTLGMTLEEIATFPRAAQWLIAALMVVGAAGPAGTGGGVKGTTLLQLTRGVRLALRGGPVTRAFGIAAAWVGAYALAALTGFLLLVWQVPQMPADQLLFMSISAASTVGFSHDPISLVGGPLVTLSALMLFGRLAPILVLWWMATTTQREDVAVG